MGSKFVTFLGKVQAVYKMVLLKANRLSPVWKRLFKFLVKAHQKEREITEFVKLYRKFAISSVNSRSFWSRIDPRKSTNTPSEVFIVSRTNC